MYVGNISIKCLYNTKKTCIIYTTIPKIFTDTAKALSSPLEGSRPSRGIEYPGGGEGGGGALEAGHIGAYTPTDVM